MSHRISRPYLWAKRRKEEEIVSSKVGGEGDGDGTRERKRPTSNSYARSLALKLVLNPETNWRGVGGARRVRSEGEREGGQVRDEKERTRMVLDREGWRDQGENRISLSQKKSIEAGR